MQVSEMAVKGHGIIVSNKKNTFVLYRLFLQNRKLK